MGAKFISVYNFSAQQLASSGKQPILNFRGMAVRDISRATNAFVEIYTYLVIFQPIQKLKYQEKGLGNACLFSMDNQSPRQPKQVPDWYTTFRRSPCWCVTQLQQHGCSILGSVNLCKIIPQISEVWVKRTDLKQQQPKTTTTLSSPLIWRIVTERGEKKTDSRN